MSKTRQVWRMENERGQGPFGEHLFTIITHDQWDQFLDDTANKWHSIEDTRHDALFLLLYAETKGYRFGVPNNIWFDRWFPSKWRSVFAQGGFRPVVYTVNADDVEEGNSEAELIFKPSDKKQVLDPITLTPIGST